VCVCVCVCVHVCMCACTRVCVRVCVVMCVYLFVAHAEQFFCFAASPQVRCACLRVVCTSVGILRRVQLVCVVVFVLDLCVSANTSSSASASAAVGSGGGSSIVRGIQSAESHCRFSARFLIATLLCDEQTCVRACVYV